MSKIDEVRSAMVAAMKAKDKTTKDAVSSLVSAVKKAAIDEGCRDDIKGELVDKVILKELKTAKEQIDTCPAERTDLKEEYQARYDIIAKYAPKQMDEAEIKAYIEEKFAGWFKQIKWINFGGGHLMTRKDYDIELLVNTLREFHNRYPWLKVIMEPGSAFGWQTGPLVAQVVDVVEDKGIKTAILNVSFSCHMPDCLEMPYHPAVRGAQTIEEDIDYSVPYIYRLGANSCLSGDFMSAWQFDHELQIGENIVFEDMNHYTTVKTTMFNGISHPTLAMVRENTNELEILREYSPKDYIERMD